MWGFGDKITYIYLSLNYLSAQKELLNGIEWMSGITAKKHIFSFYVILNQWNKLYKDRSYKNSQYILNGKVEGASNYHLFIFTERRDNFKMKWYQNYNHWSKILKL